MRVRYALALRSSVVAVVMAQACAPVAAGCSVFSRHPCGASVCSVFHRGPCFDYGPPFGEDLRLTIESTNAPEPPATSGDDKPAAEPKLDTIRAMFAALRACWVPPAPEVARPGTQMSIRFAFKRDGEIIAKPRVTYVSPGVSPQTRGIYLDAINAALARCTPLHFSPGMAGAIAGKPIAVRFVDNRTFQGQTTQGHTPDDQH
jgi:hypothetical protein